MMASVSPPKLTLGTVAIQPLNCDSVVLIFPFFFFSVMVALQKAPSAPQTETQF